LNTPHKYSARNKRIDLKSENGHPFPLETIEGRMQYAPTQAHLYLPSIQYAYPCRGVMLTPHKYSARNKRIDLKSENVHPFPLETIERRMQYAPTQAHLYHPSIKYVYPCRGVMHTPHKHPARNKWIDLKSENIHPFPLETTGGAYAIRPYAGASIPPIYPIRPYVDASIPSIYPIRVPV